MKILIYIILIPLNLWALSRAYCGNWLFAKFIDKDGNLPWYLRWFQPSDNPSTGDQSWKDEHPGMSNYDLSLSYMNRNPAQGFDQLLAAKVTMKSRCTVKGNLNISDEAGKVVEGSYYIKSEEGYFHYSYVKVIRGGVFTGGFGWRLNNIVKGYEHKTMGQFVFSPVRWR